MVPCPWYSWFSGVPQRQRFIVSQCPCTLPLSGTLFTLSNFLRNSSTLPWLGQHHCQLGYFRGAHSRPNPTVHTGLILSAASHCPVGSLTHIEGGKLHELQVRTSLSEWCLWMRSPRENHPSARGTLYHLDSFLPEHPASPCASVLQAFVIAVTSDFIPRLVYQYAYSHNGTLHGFVNHTLSFFNVSQLKEGTQPENSQFDQEVQFCR